MSPALTLPPPSLLLELLAELLSPRACAACDEPLRRRAALCAACASTLEPPDEPSEAERRGAPRSVALGAHGGALAEAVYRLKYRDRPDIAAPLGALLGQEALREGLVADVVVPVPLHPRRLAERGYNQSALLAHACARALELPCSPRMLVRTRATPRQAQLARAERLLNVAGAFEVRRAGLAGGRRVLLVDDVVTTGATTRACAETLRRDGAAEVLVATLARTAAEGS